MDNSNALSHNAAIIYTEWFLGQRHIGQRVRGLYLERALIDRTHLFSANDAGDLLLKCQSVYESVQ